MQAFDTFDAIFRERLSLIEKNPTAQLWEHIAADLDANHVKQTPDIFDDIFKNRLSSLEKIPAPQLWERIAIDIDKQVPPATFDSIFATKLANFTKEPTPHLWERIESDTNLHTENNPDTYKDVWQDKFRAYEPSTDSAIWKKVVHTLDDDAESTMSGFFKDAFANFEVQPRPKVWEEVLARLEKEDRKYVFFLPRIWYPLFLVIAFIASFITIQYFSVTPTYPSYAVIQPTPAVIRAINAPFMEENVVKQPKNSSHLSNSEHLADLKIHTINAFSAVSSRAVSIHDSLSVSISNEIFNKNIVPIIGNDTIHSQKILPIEGINGNLLSGIHHSASADTTSIIPYLPFLNIKSLDTTSTLAASVRNTLIYPIIYDNHVSLKNVPSIYIGIMPLVTYHDLSPIPARNNPINNNEVKNIMFLNRFSRQRLGLQFGGGAELALSKRLSIRTGVTYSRLTQRLVYMYKDLSNINLRDSSNQAITFGPVADKKIEQNQHIELLGLQIGLRYDVLSRPKSIQSIMGSLESAAQVHVYDSKAVKGPFVTEALIFTNLSYRAARKVGTSNYLWVEAKSQIPISSYLDSNRDIRIKPSSFGLNVGISWLLDGKAINITAFR